MRLWCLLCLRAVVEHVIAGIHLWGLQSRGRLQLTPPPQREVLWHQAWLILA